MGEWVALSARHLLQAQGMGPTPQSCAKKASVTHIDQNKKQANTKTRTFSFLFWLLMLSLSRNSSALPLDNACHVASINHRVISVESRPGLLLTTTVS